ncbi:3'-5' exonuclease [Aliarcobacter butzleri]|uniref:3'-5' exonuclease n=1 Tax=Aliarcobacter butzleri TaxID=28197 RepID=UPI0021B1CFDC|nr:3'-5' exonuclease [Aliarcobacter butzleri]MCT7633891.1 3'-5' exoribonuclease [Aliarcobacter butzleri]
MNHIMIDIETLGTNSNALVVSISAVIFDMSSNAIGDTFEVGLNEQQQLEKGAIIDQSTVDWWDKQSDEAKTMLNRLQKIDVEFALNEFNNWIKNNFSAPSKIKLWGNGATFDNVIVRNLFERHGIDFIIPYYADKDVRTLAYVAKVNTFSYKFEGVKHYGIDDCMHQIKYCQDGYQKIHNLKG